MAGERSDRDSSFADRTVLMSGGSRGIGLAIARRLASGGANVALLAKTAVADPRLQGTIHTAAAEIEEIGGAALPIVGDVRNEEDVQRAVAETVDRFGGIDICINNASAISLENSEALLMKRYDLMQDVNTRGTFLLSRACVPHLRQSDNPHVLTLSPPLDLDPGWFAPHLGYTISKFGMSMCTLGFAREFAAEGIAFNALWPRTYIATDAVRNIMGGEEAVRRSRSPEIMADAAREILRRDSRTETGRFHVDEHVLRDAGVRDFSRYQSGPDADLQLDLFIPST